MEALGLKSSASAHRRVLASWFPPISALCAFTFWNGLFSAFLSHRGHSTRAFIWLTLLCVPRRMWYQGALVTVSVFCAWDPPICKACCDWIYFMWSWKPIFRWRKNLRELRLFLDNVTLEVCLYPIGSLCLERLSWSGTVAILIVTILAFPLMMFEFGFYCLPLPDRSLDKSLPGDCVHSCPREVLSWMLGWQWDVGWMHWLCVKCVRVFWGHRPRWWARTEPARRSFAFTPSSVLFFSTLFQSLFKQLNLNYIHLIFSAC